MVWCWHDEFLRWNRSLCFAAEVDWPEKEVGGQKSWINKIKKEQDAIILLVLLISCISLGPWFWAFLSLDNAWTLLPQGRSISICLKYNYEKLPPHILSVSTTTTMNYNCCKKIIGLLWIFIYMNKNSQ